MTSDLRVDVAKVYLIMDYDQSDFISKNLITVNRKYLAILLFDYMRYKEIIRVFIRDESSFSRGHKDIEIKSMRYDINIMSFISYYLFDTLFVRNSQKWIIYKIKDPHFVINTKDYQDEFFKARYQVYNATIQTYSPISSTDYLSSSFQIYFLGNEDTKVYRLAKNSEVFIFHAYGDPQFNFEISDYFTGPFMNFDFELVNITQNNE